jgi:hypothetical protein
MSIVLLFLLAIASSLADHAALTPCVQNWEGQKPLDVWVYLREEENRFPAASPVTERALRRRELRGLGKEEDKVLDPKTVQQVTLLPELT